MIAVETNMNSFVAIKGRHLKIN